MTIGTKIIGGYMVVLSLFLLVAAGAFYARDLEQKQYERYINTREALADGASELRIAVSSQTQHYRGMFLFPQQQQYYVRELENDAQRFTAAFEKIRTAASAQDLVELREISAFQTELEQKVQIASGLVQRGKIAEAIAMSEQEMLPRARMLHHPGIGNRLCALRTAEPLSDALDQSPTARNHCATHRIVRRNPCDDLASRRCRRRNRYGGQPDHSNSGGSEADRTGQ